ncbi:MAG: hypothetical protein WC438_00545 [Candidatus Pacearchaeota archaeon]
MTVIVGLEAVANGEKAVVIGADRLQVNGHLATSQFLRYLQSKNPNNLSYCFKFLKESKMDKIKMGFGRKIKVSRDKDALLAHTGVDNDANKQICKFLLNNPRFLNQDEFLTKLLFPFDLPTELIKDGTNHYKSTYDLVNTLKKGYIPEVRRIFDMAVATKHEVNTSILRFAWWDRNYNAELSEYLFSKTFNIKGNSTPLLLDIALTGALTQRQYYAKGCGGIYALEYMRKRLGTDEFKFFHSMESSLDRTIKLDEAIDIVTGAVNYANEKSPFCKGLDYAILASKGVDLHFSNDKAIYEINLINLMNERIETLQKEISELGIIKNSYQNYITSSSLSDSSTSTSSSG